MTCNERSRQNVTAHGLLENVRWKYIIRCSRGSGVLGESLIWMREAVHSGFPERLVSEMVLIAAIDVGHSEHY
jgi:hypothetical protein